MEIAIAFGKSLLVLAVLFVVRNLSYKIESHLGQIRKFITQTMNNFKFCVWKKMAVGFMLIILGVFNSIANYSLGVAVIYFVIAIYALRFLYKPVVACQRKHNELQLIKAQFKNADRKEKYEDDIRNFEYYSFIQFARSVSQEMKGWLIALFVSLTPFVVNISDSNVFEFFANAMKTLASQIGYILLLIEFPLLCSGFFLILIPRDVYTFSSSAEARRKQSEKIIKNIL